MISKRIYFYMQTLLFDIFFFRKKYKMYSAGTRVSKKIIVGELTDFYTFLIYKSSAWKYQKHAKVVKHQPKHCFWHFYDCCHRPVLIFAPFHSELLAPFRSIAYILFVSYLMYIVTELPFFYFVLRCKFIFIEYDRICNKCTHYCYRTNNFSQSFEISGPMIFLSPAVLNKSCWGALRVANLIMISSTILILKLLWS